VKEIKSRKHAKLIIKNMKRLFLFLGITMLLQRVVFGQGLGPFDNNYRSINFYAISNAPLSNLPSGTVGFYPLIFSPDTGYSTNVLIVDINVGSAPNTDGWIVQQENDGSLIPIIQLTVGPHYTGLGSPPAWYADYISADLADSQIQSFFASQLYVQTDFGNDSYLGQLLPVPEPSVATMIFTGCGVLVLIRRVSW
jgi:hypothetical protein